MRMRLLPVLLLVAAPLAAPGSLPAQAADPDSVLVPGERVRVRWDGGRVTGTLVERDGNLLLVRPTGRDEDRRLSLVGVDRLEVWGCCTEGGSFVRGGLIGAGLALAGGAILQMVPTESANMAMAGAVLVGVPVGFVVGGLIGSASAEPREGWIEVPVPEPAPVEPGAG